MENHFKTMNEQNNSRSAAGGGSSLSASSRNVRQLGSTASAASHQNQILSALDVLGAKLVRSESERETMRKLLNDALDAQEKLENQLERSQIDVLRRIDQIESRETVLSESDRQFIEDQKKQLDSSRTDIDEQRNRQKYLEDRLRDSVQMIAKMQRRIDAQEQKRARLQRRMERLENLVSDAQNALEAKALVLLTDQSEALRALPHMNYNAGEAMQALNVLHTQESGMEEVILSPRNLWKKRLRDWSNNSSFVAIVVLLAMGMGWVMASSRQPVMPAMMMAADGRYYLPETPMAQQSSGTAVSDVPAQNIEDDIAQAAASAVNENILAEARSDVENSAAQESPANDTVVASSSTSLTDTPPDVKSDVFVDAQASTSLPDITMDRDLSLPKEIKALEDKAFARVPEAQHDLAALYTSGQAGVAQNYERAAFWFRHAAEQGIANAAYNLGVLYQQGLGQQQDLQKALDWYRRAALLNHPEAQYNLGIAYIEGVGTRYNPAMAASYFQHAAFSGIVEAAYNLGLILENGLLGEVRHKEALKWYRAAAEGGNRDAAKALQNLAKNLNIPQADAGLLEGGQTLSSYINPLHSIEPAAGEKVTPAEVGLGNLLPTDEQIMIAQIQEQLRKDHLYNGLQDGVIGSGTVKAIEAYQKKYGLTVDGEPTEQLLKFMLRNSTI